MINEVQLFLKDKKGELPLKNKGDSIKLIMEFFSTDNEDIEDLEKPKYNQEYETLGWKDEPHFDVISSFYNIYCCGLAWVCSDKTCKDYGANWAGNWRKSPPFIMDEDGKLKVFFTIPGDDKPNHNPMTKKKLANKILDSETIYSRVSKELISSKNKYIDFAAWTHSVANFMPCPPPPYNKAKGLTEGIHDFISLFIDLIDTHCEQGKSVTFYDYKQGPVEVKVETLQSWKDWFIRNHKKYCLEDYYYIYTDEKNVKHIKGIPFFESQSLENPLPREEREIEECLNEMVCRILARAYRLAGLQRNKGAEA